MKAKRYLGDSDLLIKFLRGDLAARDFFTTTDPDEVAYSVVTYLEVAGFEFARDPRDARTVQQLFGKAAVLPFTAAMARRAARVQGQLVRGNQRMSVTDLQIAATAEAHHLVLVTRNTGHFGLYAAVELQRW